MMPFSYQWKKNSQLLYNYMYKASEKLPVEIAYFHSWKLGTNKCYIYFTHNNMFNLDLPILIHSVEIIESTVLLITLCYVTVFIERSEIKINPI